MKESRFAWVYKGEQSKQVLLDEVNQHILDGWIKGRPTKFSIPEDEIRDYMEKHMTIVFSYLVKQKRKYK